MSSMAHPPRPLRRWLQSWCASRSPVLKHPISPAKLEAGQQRSLGRRPRRHRPQRRPRNPSRPRPGPRAKNLPRHPLQPLVLLRRKVRQLPRRRARPAKHRAVPYRSVLVSGESPPLLPLQTRRARETLRVPSVPLRRAVNRHRRHLRRAAWEAQNQATRTRRHLDSHQRRAPTARDKHKAEAARDRPTAAQVRRGQVK